MSVIRTEKAEEDIKEIYKHSFGEFGEAQAEKYYAGLEKRFISILEKTVHSTDYSFVAHNLRRTNYMSHAIYYRIEGDDVVIIRVLGQKMDELRHLDDS